MRCALRTRWRGSEKKRRVRADPKTATRNPWEKRLSITPPPPPTTPWLRQARPCTWEKQKERRRSTTILASARQLHTLGAHYVGAPLKVRKNLGVAVQWCSRTRPPMDPKPARVWTQDGAQLVLLTALYFLQGVPLGLCGGSLPFILKSRVSFTQIGLFSVATLPFSLK